MMVELLSPVEFRDRYSGRQREKLVFVFPPTDLAGADAGFGGMSEDGRFYEFGIGGPDEVYDDEILWVLDWGTLA